MVTPKNKKLWKDGEEVPLEYVEVGDYITFRTPDQPDKAGVVARLMDLGEQDHLRKVAFLDRNQYVLNGYPDKVTKAYWTVTKEEKLKAEKVEKKKKSKQYRYFEKKKPGTSYGIELSKASSHLYIKIEDDRWVWIETGSRGYFDKSDYIKDETVFESVLLEDGNLMRELKPL